MAKREEKTPFSPTLYLMLVSSLITMVIEIQLFWQSINVAKNFSFSSLLCMTALTTAIGMHIESYFPTKTFPFSDVYEVLHNRILSPRP